MSDPIPPRAEDGAYAGDIEPRESWKILQKDTNAVLVDVRTDAEFSYVGVPDLSSLGKETKLISWILFPNNEVNPEFLDQLASVVPERDAQILFLCRSGVRSRFAASAVTEAGYDRCYNVLEGFEGDKNPAGHRSTIGGWKVAGLPWVQG